MIVHHSHDRLMLVGTLLVAAGVIASRTLDGYWSSAGLISAVAGAILLVAGIVMKIAAGR